MPAKNVDNVVMTDNTLYATTGNRNTNLYTGQATISRSPKEGKFYAIKCDHGISSSPSIKPRL